jgi:hypothetical protein
MRHQIWNYKKLALSFALLPIATLSLWPQTALADTLKTKNFNVKITRNCPEGYVTCNDVTYYGRHRKTNASIYLTGKTIHNNCADGVTPCQFLGYEFRNQQYLYRVTADGKLQVYKGRKLILEERGTLVF